MPLNHSENDETVCTAPPTSYGGFHKDFVKESFESHITEIFIS